MRTTDNNRGNFIIEDCHLSDIKTIANKSLQELKQENNLLLFPLDFGMNEKEDDENPVFSLQEKKLQTYNILGFVGINDTQLTISSRFYPDGNDYFLHY